MHDHRYPDSVARDTEFYQFRLQAPVPTSTPWGNSNSPLIVAAANSPATTEILLKSLTQYLCMSYPGYRGPHSEQGVGGSRN